MLRAGRPRNRGSVCWQGRRHLVSKSSCPDLEPTGLPFQGVTRDFSHMTKQPGRAADHSPNLKPRSRSEWRCLHSPIWLNTVQRGLNFTCMLLWGVGIYFTRDTVTSQNAKILNNAERNSALTLWQSYSNKRTHIGSVRFGQLGGYNNRVISKFKKSH
jgi:hypothetical protein